MRKLVIVPSFASSHFLKCWLPNVIETLEPDIIIINEGLFPEGPENKGHIYDEFRKKWCFGESNVGFDIQETFKIKHQIELDLIKFQGISWKPKIIINPIRYTSLDVNKCFLNAISTFVISDFQPEPGDILFPIEPDAFLLETDKDIIQEEISRLKPGEGLKCLWRDFLGTQYYCEAINEISPKIRRFCYCFDNMSNYKKAMDGFMSQSYPLLQYTDKFWIRHYPWFVHDKWKELRYDLIWRNDPKYWQDFEIGLNQIRLISERVIHFKDKEGWLNSPTSLNKVIVRPSRTDEGRWAQFVDISHPRHIMNHPNFIK